MDVLALYVLRLLIIILASYYTFVYVSSRTGSVVIGGMVGLLSGLVLVVVTPTPEGGRFDL